MRRFVERKKIISVLFGVFFFFASTSLHAQSSYPQWWLDRGVIDTNYTVINDYGVLNAGQLKWIATNAFDELNSHGGAGPAILNFVSGFTHSNNYAVVNRGQLKYAASLFYNRLAELNCESETNYPWPDCSLDRNDYAAANIGQAKYLFSFVFTNGFWESSVSPASGGGVINTRTVFDSITSRPWTGPTNSVVFSNSISLNMSVYETTGLARYYLSSAPGYAGGWMYHVTGLIARMIDVNGTILATYDLSSAGDSIDITADIPSSGQFSLLLIYTGGGTIDLGAQVYLLSWKPVLSLNDSNFYKINGTNCAAKDSTVQVPLTVNILPPCNAGFSIDLYITGTDFPTPLELDLTTQSNNIAIPVAGYDYYLNESQMNVQYYPTSATITNLYYTRVGVAISPNEEISALKCYYCNQFVRWDGTNGTDDVTVNFYPPELSNPSLTGTVSITVYSQGDVASDSVYDPSQSYGLGDVNPYGQFPPAITAAWTLSPSFAVTNSNIIPYHSVGVDLTATPNDSSPHSASLISGLTKVRLDVIEGLGFIDALLLTWPDPLIKLGGNSSQFEPADETDYLVTRSDKVPRTSVTVDVSGDGIHDCPEQSLHTSVMLTPVSNTNTEANPDSEIASTTEPINTMTGDVWMEETDVVLPCPGTDISFARYYNSRSTFTGNLGPCWAHSYELMLEQKTNAVYKSIYGDWMVLSVPSGQQHWFKHQDDGTFLNPLDNNMALSKPGADYIISLAGGYSWTFDTNGVLKKISSAAGEQSLTYTGTYPSNHLSVITNSNGQYLNFTFSGNLITRIDTPVTNFYVTFGYNTSNELSGVTRTIASTQQVCQYLYDVSTHSITQRVNAMGDKFNYGYEYISNLASQTVSRGTSMWLNAENYYHHTVNYTNQGDNKTEVIYYRDGATPTFVYEYNPIINMVENMYGPDGMNLETKYDIDDSLDTTVTTYFDNSTSDAKKLVRTFDTNHNVVTEGYCYKTESATNLWTYTWDQTFKLPATITDPEGSKAGFSYTNGLISVSRIYYNQNDSYDTVFSYNSSNLLSCVTNANGHWVKYEYDGYGMLNKVQPQEGPSVSYSNNSLGFVKTITMPGDSGSRTITVSPNELGWITNILYPDSLSETFAFDAIGNLTNHVDKAGRTTRYTYLPTKKLSSVTRQLGTSNLTTSLSYDKQFNVLKITDAKSRDVETYTLDSRDRPYSIVNIEGQTETIAYGIGSRIDSVCRFDGTTVNNSYDSNDLLSAVSGPSFTNSFTYLKNGLLSTLADEQGTISNSWSFANRLSSSEFQVSSFTSQVSYTYYPAGQVSNVVSIAGTNTYVLDNADRVLALRSLGVGGAVEYQYSYSTNNALLSTVDCTNSGINVSYAYNVIDHVTNIVWRNSTGTVLRSFAYGYNNAGMTTGTTYETGERAVYGCDELNQLTNVVYYSSGGTETGHISCAYDFAGNRTSTVIDGVTSLYTYGAGNRLASWGAGTTNEFDSAGNVTNLKYSASLQLALSWDSRYRLTEVRTNGVLAESYQYDVAGRRISISDGTATNYMVYDANNVIAETDSSGSLTKSYVYGPAGLLCMTTYGISTNTYFMLTDCAGTVHGVCDATGAVVESYKYDAFGRVLGVYDGSGLPIGNQQSAIGNRFLFHGREYSWKTGLYLNGARWYDPITGRFISKDPSGISGGLNEYVFCNNNPVNYIDPTGEGPVALHDWFNKGAVSGAEHGGVAGFAKAVACSVGMAGIDFFGLRAIEENLRIASQYLAGNCPPGNVSNK